MTTASPVSADFAQVALAQADLDARVVLGALSTALPAESRGRATRISALKGFEHPVFCHEGGPGEPARTHWPATSPSRGIDRCSDNFR